MPIYAYYDGGTGPLYANIEWTANATTATATTSSWYPFGGATYATPTLATITQGGYYTPSRILYHDAQWIAFQNRAASIRRNQENQCVGLGDHLPAPVSPAIIRERAEAETQRRREMAAQAAEQVAQRQAEAKRRAEAMTRARELLLEHLTPEQRRMFEKENWFIVEGGKSKTKYRIRGGAVAGNIDVIRNDAVSHRLCCHCDSSIPSHDQHLAQKLMLEHAEDDFLRIANRQ